MDFELRSDRRGLPRSGLVVSGILHLVVLVGLLLAPALQQPPAQFETFEIELIATSPTPVPLPPVTEDLVIETPDPSPPSPPDELPPPDPRPDPEETLPVSEEVEPEPEPEPEDPPAEDPPADDPPPSDDPPPEIPVDEAPAEETGSNVDVRMEGLKRDYPVYYANIVQQIQDCWRAPPGNSRWRAVLYFEIDSDGTVSVVRPVERSGSAAFDYSAIGAVADCAGRGRFGPLPDEMPFEVLPVQFTFEPRGIGGG